MATPRGSQNPDGVYLPNTGVPDPCSMPVIRNDVQHASIFNRINWAIEILCGRVTDLEGVVPAIDPLSVRIQMGAPGGAVLATGPWPPIEFPRAYTITGWSLFADQAAGSIVIDLWKDTYANYPPTVGDTITAAAKPALVAAQKNESSVLTGWTTSIVAGNSIIPNIDSVSGDIVWAVLNLKLVRV